MPRALLVRITGHSCVGKSTIAEALCNAIRRDARVSSTATLLSTDWYYLDLAANPDHRRGFDFTNPDAIDWPVLANTLTSLQNWRPYRTPRYDFVTATRLGLRTLTRPSRFIVMEGLFALDSALSRAWFDHTVLVHASEAVRFARCIRRDVFDLGCSREQAIRMQIHASTAF